MSDSTLRKITGFLFILSPLWLFVNTLLLGRVSGFPDIQFKGVDALLTRVAESGSRGIFVWYAYIIAGVLYIASIVLFDKVLSKDGVNRPWFHVATAMGVCAWAIQFFGLVRWIFVYPYLAKEWVNTSDPATRETLKIVFHAFNNYAGFALGQTVGIGLTALWILLVGFAIRKSPLFKPWLAWAAIIIAIGEFVGNVGPLGSVIPEIKIQTFFNISGLFWRFSFLWMAYLGVIMMRAKSDSREVAGGLHKPAVA
jgi:hypothetical protein